MYQIDLTSLIFHPCVQRWKNIASPLSISLSLTQSTSFRQYVDSILCMPPSITYTAVRNLSTPVELEQNVILTNIFGFETLVRKSKGQMTQKTE
jgi:hypothetical protein